MREQTTTHIPKVNFCLKWQKDKAKEALIIVVANKGKKRFVYTTKKSVFPKYWDRKLQKVKNSVNQPSSNPADRADDINTLLIKISESFKDIYKDHPYIGFDLKFLKIELDYRLGRKERPRPKHLTLYQFIEKKIEHKKRELKLRAEGKDIKGGQTWRKYENCLNKLKGFAKTEGVDEWNYEDINLGFRDDYELHLKELGLSINTISKEIELLKSFLGASHALYHENKFYNHKDFIIQRVPTEKVFPTLAELKILANYKFDKVQTQEVVDLCLISAFLGGLRYSDVMRLTKDNLLPDGQSVQVYTFKGRNTKGDTKVVIPVTPQFQTIADKYDWQFPKISNNKVNEIIKQAFKSAGLDGIRNLKSGEVKLNEKVTYHSFRYAFINFMINDLDVSAERLRLITGQSLQVLLSYAKGGDKEKNSSDVGQQINAKLQGLHVVKKNAG